MTAQARLVGFGSISCSSEHLLHAHAITSRTEADMASFRTSPLFSFFRHASNEQAPTNNNFFPNLSLSSPATTMTSRDTTSFTYSSVPVPHDRREEEDQMREAIAASLGTTSDMVDPELVQRNLGRDSHHHSPRRGTSSRLPMARGVFC